MDFKINKKVFMQGLEKASSVTEKRNAANPVLSHVLMIVKGGNLQMTATDTELAFTGDFKVDVKSTGGITVDALSLFQIVKGLPGDVVHLKRGKKDRLQVSSKSSDYKLMGLPADRYPVLPDFDEKAAVQLSEGHLRWLVEMTAYAACGDDNRYGINGGHIEVVDTDEGKRLRMVTTDGHRLAYAQVPFEGEFGMPERMLIPRKALAEIKKICSRGEQTIDLLFGESSAVLRTATERFFFRLIDGEFPDYLQIIPTSDPAMTVSAVRSDLNSTLKRVNVLVSGRFPTKFFFQDGLLTVSSNTTNGQAREELKVQATGKSIQIGLSSQLLQESLRRMEGASIEMDIRDPLSVVVLREPDRSDSLNLIMPMRLD